MAILSNIKLGKIYIKRRNPQEWLVFLFFVLPFVLALLTEIFKVPAVVRFSLDALLLCLGGMLFQRRHFVIQSKAKPMLTLALLFFLYALIVYLFNFQSLFYFIWGTRNTFRFYIAFLVFAAYVNEDEAFNWLKLMDVLFWIHFIAASIQFLVFHVQQDFLGGIFGVNASANGYTLIFFCIVISKSLLRAFDGEEKTIYCVLKCLASLLVAAMAEMKFYYIAFILILVIAACLTRSSRRKLILLIVGIAGVLIGAELLMYWFEEFENFLSFESLWELATKENYSSGEDLNRLSAIFILARDYIANTAQAIFGMGLGNCDVSEVAIFNSPFYQSYSYLHYTWFSSAMLFLETGFVGLALYISFFVLCFKHARRQMKDMVGNRLFCQMSIVMSILCLVIMFYNSALRIESGYMAYFALALPFLSSDTSQSDGKVLRKHVGKTVRRRRPSRV